MDAEEIRRGIEAILFAAGEPVGAERMALAMGISVDTIHQEAKVLQDELSFQRRGVRIVTPITARAGEETEVEVTLQRRSGDARFYRIFAITKETK